MTFIYLHGFNSHRNPTSDKLKELGTLGEVITLTYNSFAPYEDILKDHLEKVKEVLRNRPPCEVTIVGTSLGGYSFWYLRSASYTAICCYFERLL